ncbi:NAAT family transporter [Klebsiella pneumoniae subsp. pneumoniae]|nr:NAAT family transporter [Klebsiella pneumoniae subsp. pneumoniae]
MTQSLFDFSAYFKFFIGLFALVNPVGIIPVFISMTSYQPAAVRNKTNLTANLSVAIILLTSLFLGDGILQIFGISIDSFRIAGGILVVTIAMSMISGKLGEDKQNKQGKVGDGGPGEHRRRSSRATINGRARGNQFNYRLGTRYHSWVHLVGFSLAIAVFALCCWGFSVWRRGWSVCWGRRESTSSPVLWACC